MKVVYFTLVYSNIQTLVTFFFVSEHLQTNFEPHKQVNVFIGISTLTQLWGHLHFQYTSFLRAHKKHKNANKRINDFFSLRCFLDALFIFDGLQLFVLLLGCVFVLSAPLVRAKSFPQKKIKSLKLNYNMHKNKNL